MILLFREAALFQEFLEAQRWPFCFIGGIALQHWGEPRVTRDLYVSVFTGFGGEPEVVDALLRRFHGRIADAREFALEYRVLLLRTEGGVEVDVVLSGLPFESEVVKRAIRVAFAEDIELRIASAEDLFVLKAFADRPQDRADLIGIAHRRGKQLDWDAITERLGPLVDAKSEPRILDHVRLLRAEVEE